MSDERKPVFLGFFLLGLENSHYFLSQSVFKLKSIVPWSRAFSRASGSLFVVFLLRVLTED